MTVRVRKRNRFHADWHPEDAMEAARHGSVLGVRGALREVLREADPITPYETGELRDSAFINDDDNGRGVVGYTAAHAAMQHENPEHQFQGRGQGKWLETALKNASGSLLGKMASELRSKLS